MYRRQSNNINTIDFQAYIDRFEQRHREDRQAMEERLAADREASESRLAADRKEASERLAAERKDFEAKFVAERAEARATRNWLIATFITLIVGFASILVAIFAINGYLP